MLYSKRSMSARRALYSLSTARVSRRHTSGAVKNFAHFHAGRRRAQVVKLSHLSGWRLRLQESQNRPPRLLCVIRKRRVSMSCWRSAKALRRASTRRVLASIMRLTVDMVCCSWVLICQLTVCKCKMCMVFDWNVLPQERLLITSKHNVRAISIQLHCTVYTQSSLT
jgi:hypothetical protein